MRMILKFIFFVIQTLHICGKVIVLYGAPHTENFKTVQNVICLSEDDGGALVWINQINSMKDVSFYKNNKFYSLDTFNDHGINCKMNEDTDCLQSWSRPNWYLTNSMKTPMGPVFDQRWEEFEEYSNFGSFNRLYLKNQMPSAGALSFSTRAPDNVYLLFCHTEDYVNSPCFWVIIGGWDNKRSAIRKCMSGVPSHSPPTNGDCFNLKDVFNHTPLSATEWRTFVVTWNFTESSRKISAYDTDTLFLTYEETTNYEKYLPSSFNYIFIKTISSMLFRAHEYDFLHTSTKNATLASPAYQFINSTICIQVLIGLCTECDADVVMLDAYNNDEVIQNVTVKGSLKAAIHNLPMWQVVKLNTTFLPANYHSVKIQVIPKLRASSPNPLWAIADVRQCSKKESLRKGNILTSNIYTSPWYFTNSIMICQKLSYTEHTVVYPFFSKYENVASMLDENCPEGKIGPGCSTSCAVDLKSNADCESTSVCSNHGCLCLPGFYNNHGCSQRCNNNWYGYECKYKCGSCKNEKCNHITGTCMEGCADNSEEIYIPPLCHIGINKLPAPLIVSISKTSIRTELYLVWKKEYEPLTIKYSFILKENETNSMTQLQLNSLFPNMTLTHMTGYFENLKPGSFYWIRCVLYVENKRIQSEWQSAVTDCDSFTQLKVNGWMLSWQPPKNCSITILRPLTASIQISGVSHYVKNYSSSVLTNNTYFDLNTTIPPLNGAEQYKTNIYVIRDYINISMENVYSSQEELYFETPPIAPPAVTNLEVVEIDDRVPSSIIVYLKWQSPLSPLNGKLHYYTVDLCSHNDKNDCRLKRVELNNHCDLWDNYICENLPISSIRNLTILVYAYNENVTTPGAPTTVSQEMLENTKPDVPEDFTYQINDSVVDLQWRQPRKTGRHLRCFRITIEEKTSNLKKRRTLRLTNTRKTQEYPVKQYTRYYKERLRLFSSTKYSISIQAVTITNKTSTSEVLELQTLSSASFDGDLQIIEQNSTIMLHIPPVLNDTHGSVIHIIVKGPNRCEKYSEVPNNLRERAGLKMHEIAWQAAIISTDEIASRNYTFILGDNQSYGNVTNCLFYLKTSYKVAVIVEEQSLEFWESSKSLMLTISIDIGAVPVHHEAWLIPILLLLSAVVAVYYIYRRRNQQSEKQISYDEIILSENIKINEIDATSVISKENLTTRFDKQSLSHATTSEVPLIVVDKDRKKPGR